MAKIYSIPEFLFDHAMTNEMGKIVCLPCQWRMDVIGPVFTRFPDPQPLTMADMDPGPPELWNKPTAPL